MELLGDVGHVESHFFPFADSVSSMQDRCTICTKRTLGSGIVLDAPDGTSRRRGSRESSVQLEIVLILAQNRCTVFFERSIGFELVLDALDGTPR
jgi:hypothetical protein